MTVNEKTRLLASENQKPYVVEMPQQEDVNNNSSIVEHVAWQALTREQMKQYEKDPDWIQIRRIFGSLYWLLWAVALICALYIAADARLSGWCELTFENNGSAMLYNGSSTLAPATSAGADNSGVVLRMLNQPSS